MIGWFLEFHWGLCSSLYSRWTNAPREITRGAKILKGNFFIEQLSWNFVKANFKVWDKIFVEGP